MLPLCRVRDYVKALLPVMLPGAAGGNLEEFMTQSSTTLTLDSFVDGSVAAVFFSAASGGE